LNDLFEKLYLVAAFDGWEAREREDDSAGFSLSRWERVGERGEATTAGS